ncbi:MAG TPA: hypothetical protein VFU98_17345, partial [Microlunatus sp.]|nr:hypothetical protein [Microlunatus sp.]
MADLPDDTGAIPAQLRGDLSILRQGAAADRSAPPPAPVPLQHVIRDRSLASCSYEGERTTSRGERSAREDGAAEPPHRRSAPEHTSPNGVGVHDLWYEVSTPPRARRRATGSSQRSRASAR